MIWTQSLQILKTLRIPKPGWDRGQYFRLWLLWQRSLCRYKHCLKYFHDSTTLEWFLYCDNRYISIRSRVVWVKLKKRTQYCSIFYPLFRYQHSLFYELLAMSKYQQHLCKLCSTSYIFFQVEFATLTDSVIWEIMQL